MGKEEYSLKFTPKAVDDLDEIYGYIATSLFAPEAAKNLMDKIEIGIMRLKAFPYSCSFVLDEPLKKRGYRKLIVDNYIVFYLVNEQERQGVRGKSTKSMCGNARTGTKRVRRAAA